MKFVFEKTENWVPNGDEQATVAIELRRISWRGRGELVDNNFRDFVNESVNRGLSTVRCWGVVKVNGFEECRVRLKGGDGC